MKTITLTIAAACSLVAAPASARARDVPSPSASDERYDLHGQALCAGQWRAWYADWLGEPGNPRGQQVAAANAERTNGYYDEAANRAWFEANCM